MASLKYRDPITGQFVPLLGSGISEAEADAKYALKSDIPAALPIGTVCQFAGETTPPLWFLCQGQNVSRLEFRDLFNAIGVAYGVGNGSTTFTLPNFMGRVPVGVNPDTAANWNTRGQMGGEGEHTLTLGEFPAHMHGIDQAVSWPGPQGGARQQKDWQGWSGGGNWVGGINGTANAGAGGPHNNMQYYTVIHYIIKGL